MATVIGSYCSAFDITQPSSTTAYKFYRTRNANATGTKFYVATSVVTTATVTTATGTAIPTLSSVTSLTLIPSLYELPNIGNVTSAGGNDPCEHFKELKFKLQWFPSITPLTNTTPVIPSNKRRFLTWDQKTSYASSDAYRFVNLTNAADLTGGIRFDTAPTAVTATPALPTSLEFEETNDSPTFTVSSKTGMYIVNKQEFEAINQKTTASKQLTYYTFSTTTSGSVTTGTLKGQDLYDPDVTTATISAVKYFIMNQTKHTINGDGSCTTTQNWSINFSTNGALNTGTTTPFGDLNTDRFTIPGKYADIKAAFAAGFDGVSFFDDGGVEYMFTSRLVDKAVDELFTDVSVTLLQLVKLRFSATALVSQPYLGLETVNPTTPITTAVAALPADGKLTAAFAHGLIFRDYFNFQNPAMACQFRFYDLGKGTEYLWQARWPDGKYVYIVADAGKIKYLPTIDANVRGWQFENAGGNGSVYLKWAEGNYYVVASLGTTTATVSDTNPYRIDLGTMVDRENAAIFKCIKCTRIDTVTGACLLQDDATAVPLSDLNVKYGATTIRTGPSSYLKYELSKTASSPSVSIVTSASGATRFEFVQTNALDFDKNGNGTLFLRVENSGDQYLKVNADKSVNIIVSNKPTVVDGFGWNVMSFGPGYVIRSASETIDNGGYLNTDGRNVITPAPSGTSIPLFMFDIQDIISTRVPLTVMYQARVPSTPATIAPPAITSALNLATSASHAIGNRFIFFTLGNTAPVTSGTGAGAAPGMGTRTDGVLFMYDLQNPANIQKTREILAGNNFHPISVTSYGNTLYIVGGSVNTAARTATAGVIVKVDVNPADGTVSGDAIIAGALPPATVVNGTLSAIGIPQICTNDDGTFVYIAETLNSAYRIQAFNTTDLSIKLTSQSLFSPSSVTGIAVVKNNIYFLSGASLYTGGFATNGTFTGAAAGGPQIFTRISKFNNQIYVVGNTGTTGGQIYRVATAPTVSLVQVIGGTGASPPAAVTTPTTTVYNQNTVIRTLAACNPIQVSFNQMMVIDVDTTHRIISI